MAVQVAVRCKYQTNALSRLRSQGYGVPRESPRRPFHLCVEARVLTRRLSIEIAAEDSRLYTEPVARTKRIWQFTGIRRLPRRRSPRRPKAGWTFLQKKKSFALFQFFSYHPNANQMNTQLANFPKILLQFVIAIGLCAIGPSLAIAQLANINPIKDNTLYQFVPADGDRSNALGNHFFAGETGMGELRRGVVAFDIAGNVPAGSTILGVTLSLNMSRAASDTSRTVELHKLLADWGEGTSVAPGEEGDGAPATTNDATWRHRFFDTIFWTTQGGDFSATLSASQSVGAVGVYTWSSSQMVADVQSWLDNPATNFGWLVLGDESESATAKRFDTRESASPPVLTIQYTPPPSRPTPTPRPRPTPHPRPTPQ